MASPHAVPSPIVQSETRRRKVRKGTHSCWECKRRKMKCIFDPINPSMCIGCRRRRIDCISQEFPEEVSLPKDENQGGCNDGRCRTNSTGERGEITSGSLSFQRSMRTEFAQRQTFINCKVQKDQLECTNTASAPESKHEALARFLYESLPCQEDIEKIAKASHLSSILAVKMLTQPYSVLEHDNSVLLQRFLESPKPGSHPVLVARTMLQLAICLHHLHPEVHTEIQDLSEPTLNIMERLAELAIKLVTTNDEFVGSIESLQCVMMEGVYHTNIGNLRRAWITCRRAMSIAQLMGIDRSDHQTHFKVLEPTAKYHTQHMWFRINDLECHLSLMLGLPRGSIDSSLVSESILANDTAIGRLERIHCDLASRIQQRNSSKACSRNFDLTQQLDLDLQKAARTLPSKWWLAPTLHTVSSNPLTLFWDTRRLFLQILHYNLLNQLHLPFMLRWPSIERNYEYSRMTCVNASREIISRFVALRSFNRVAYCCRTIDFFALMAAMTLLLAHLDGHLLGLENLLAHQYLSDRAMIEQVQENMEEINRQNADPVSAQSADLLRQLLSIELGTVDGYPYTTRKVKVQDKGVQQADYDDDIVVSVDIPYFGIIKITREGLKTENVKGKATTAPFRSAVPRENDNGQTNDHRVQPCNVSEPGESMDTGFATSFDRYLGTSQIKGAATIETRPEVAEEIPQYFASQSTNSPLDIYMQNERVPDLVAGVDDWALQGVEMAYFDNLMVIPEEEEAVDM